MQVKKFELVFINKNCEEYVEYVELSDSNEGFTSYNNPKEIYKARKVKWPELYEDIFLEKKSTMTIKEEYPEEI